jgi:hypothetical protein
MSKVVQKSVNGKLKSWVKHPSLSAHDGSKESLPKAKGTISKNNSIAATKKKLSSILNGEDSTSYLKDKRRSTTDQTITIVSDSSQVLANYDECFDEDPEEEVYHQLTKLMFRLEQGLFVDRKLHWNVAQRIYDISNRSKQTLAFLSHNYKKSSFYYIHEKNSKLDLPRINNIEISTPKNDEDSELNSPDKSMFTPQNLDIAGLESPTPGNCSPNASFSFDLTNLHDMCKDFTDAAGLSSLDSPPKFKSGQSDFPLKLNLSPVLHSISKAKFPTMSKNQIKPNISLKKTLMTPDQQPKESSAHSKRRRCSGLLGLAKYKALDSLCINKEAQNANTDQPVKPEQIDLSVLSVRVKTEVSEPCRPQQISADKSLLSNSQNSKLVSIKPFKSGELKMETVGKLSILLGNLKKTGGITETLTNAHKAGIATDRLTSGSSQRMNETSKEKPYSPLLPKKLTTKKRSQNKSTANTINQENSAQEERVLMSDVKQKERTDLTSPRASLDNMKSLKSVLNAAKINKNNTGSLTMILPKAPRKESKELGTPEFTHNIYNNESSTPKPKVASIKGLSFLSGRSPVQNCSMQIKIPGGELTAKHMKSPTLSKDSQQTLRTYYKNLSREERRDTDREEVYTEPTSMIESTPKSQLQSRRLTGDSTHVTKRRSNINPFLKAPIFNKLF